MKKISTLTCSLFVLACALFSQPVFSQVSFRSPTLAISVSKGYAAPRYVESYSFARYERDRLIAGINAAYNQQVKQTMKLRFSASRKIDLIQQLDRERAVRIQNLNARFMDPRNKYNDYYYDRNVNRTRW